MAEIHNLNLSFQNGDNFVAYALYWLPKLTLSDQLLMCSTITAVMNFYSLWNNNIYQELNSYNFQPEFFVQPTTNLDIPTEPIYPSSQNSSDNDQSNSTSQVEALKPPVPLHRVKSIATSDIDQSHIRVFPSSPKDKLHLYLLILKDFKSSYSGHTLELIEKSGYVVHSTVSKAASKSDNPHRIDCARQMMDWLVENKPITPEALLEIQQSKVERKVPVGQSKLPIRPNPTVAKPSKSSNPETLKPSTAIKKSAKSNKSKSVSISSPTAKEDATPFPSCPQIIPVAHSSSLAGSTINDEPKLEIPTNIETYVPHASHELQVEAHPLLNDQVKSLTCSPTPKTADASWKDSFYSIDSDPVPIPMPIKTFPKSLADTYLNENIIENESVNNFLSTHIIKGHDMPGERQAKKTLYSILHQYMKFNSKSQRQQQKNPYKIPMPWQDLRNELITSKLRRECHLRKRPTIGWT